MNWRFTSIRCARSLVVRPGALATAAFNLAVVTCLEDRLLANVDTLLITIRYNHTRSHMSIERPTFGLRQRHVIGRKPPGTAASGDFVDRRSTRDPVPFRYASSDL